MQFKAKKKLGLGLCIPAVLFLFDPIIAFTDVLPNCIGYLLLCAAISQAADLNDRVSAALERFKKMLWISIGALAVQFYINRVLPSGSENINIYEAPVLRLLFSFVLLILHCYFLVPAYRDLFLGIGILADRCGGGCVLQSDKHGKNRCERMASAATGFAIWNALLALLPELSVLTTFEFAVERISFDWYAFIGLFRTVAGLMSAVVSAVFLIRFMRYVNMLLRDTPLMDKLKERYEQEVVPNTFALGMRRYRFAFVFFMIGSVFTARIRMDEKELLPCAFCAVFFLIGIWWLDERLRERRAAWISCVTLATASFLQMWRTSAYLARYSDAQASLYSSEAFRFYLTVRICMILEIVLTVFAVCMLLRVLMSLVRERVRVIYGGEGSNAVADRASARLHRKLQFRSYGTAAAFILSSAASIVEVIMGVLYPWLWWITLLFSVVAIVVFFALLFAILDELEDCLSTEWLYKREISAHTASVTPNIKKECSNHAEQQSEQSEQQSKQRSEP